MNNLIFDSNLIGSIILSFFEPFVIIIFIAVVLVLLYLFFHLFENLRSDERNKNEEKLYNYLFHSYLNSPSNVIISELELDAKNKFIIDIPLVLNGYKYLSVVSDRYRTVKIFQFHNDLCTGFYIQSYLEKYSLPYWNYFLEYVKIFQHERVGIDSRLDRMMLTSYTVERFLEPFLESLAYFNDNITEMFRKYYKIDENRFLSINLECPELFPRSNNPVFFYLCTINPNNMLEFRKYVQSIYLKFLYYFSVDVDALHKNILHNKY
jgi:hypothetical protein